MLCLRICFTQVKARADVAAPLTRCGCISPIPLPHGKWRSEVSFECRAEKPANSNDKSGGVSGSIVPRLISHLLTKYKSREAVGKVARHGSPEPCISVDITEVQASDGGAPAVK